MERFLPWVYSSPSTHLDVGDGRVQRAGPVHQSLAPVDHAFIVHTDKGLLDCIGKFLEGKRKVHQVRYLETNK